MTTCKEYTKDISDTNKSITLPIEYRKIKYILIHINDFEMNKNDFITLEEYNEYELVGSQSINKKKCVK
jgi:hypothetical protein